MARRTKEEAQETRSRILDAAERVFRDRGVSGTSLEDIADAAEVTRGAIYWHFANKADLFLAMSDRVTLPMEEMVKQAADDAITDPLARLREACVHALKKTVEDPRCRRVFEILCYRCEYVGELSAILDRHRQCRSSALILIERALRNAVTRGQLPPKTDVRRMAIGLDAYFFGLIYTWLLDPASFDLAKDAERLVDIYLDSGAVRRLPAQSAPRPGKSSATNPHSARRRAGAGSSRR
ncbi:MAG: TetR family transcriptional regulator [Burkholderiales bacterium]|nr:MAG: TetR family transcriptional regulator [Burkholderiales bacterium]